MAGKRILFPPKETNVSPEHVIEQKRLKWYSQSSSFVSFSPISPSMSASASIPSESDSLSSFSHSLLFHVQETPCTGKPSCSSPSLSPSPNMESLYNKPSKRKRVPMQEKNSEVENSLISLSSVISQHYAREKLMDEDDTFCTTILFQLRKLQEPQKTEMKRQMLKLLFDF